MSYELMKRETASEISGSEQFMDVVIAVAGLKQFVPTIQGNCEFISGDSPAELADRLIARLREDSVIQ